MTSTHETSIPPQWSLDGRIALVTGATGNLGRAFAFALASAGADLIITGRDAARLETLAGAIVNSTDASVSTVPCDLLDAADTEAMASKAISIHGRVDILLNNAVPRGSRASGDLFTTPEAAWAEMYELIVSAARRVTVPIARTMIANGGGSIINVVSTAGMSPTPGRDAYGLAKGGLVLLTKYMAKEWGHANVRVNALNPGAIDPTGTGDGRDELLQRGILQRVSLERMGRPDEVVGAAVFLASDASSYISGQVLSVDGGRF